MLFRRHENDRFSISTIRDVFPIRSKIVRFLKFEIHTTATRDSWKIYFTIFVTRSDGGSCAERDSILNSINVEPGVISIFNCWKKPFSNEYSLIGLPILHRLPAVRRKFIF